MSLCRHRWRRVVGVCHQLRQCQHHDNCRVSGNYQGFSYNAKDLQTTVALRRLSVSSFWCYLRLCRCIWGLWRQKQAFKASLSNYTHRILWDAITKERHKYLPLVPKLSYIVKEDVWRDKHRARQSDKTENWHRMSALKTYRFEMLSIYCRFHLR